MFGNRHAVASGHMLAVWVSCSFNMNNLEMVHILHTPNSMLAFNCHFPCKSGLAG